MIGVQMLLPLEVKMDDSEKFFELYVKSGLQEFVSHVRFFKAKNLEEAEDAALEVNPDYWKTMRVRPVKMDYVWRVFQDLHFSYNICKTLLDLIDLD
jgi:hypothetical protein|tara:strand:+ start:1325 stop:1615 length:291 start_codon:yes stop_codon:yes gene_type:complete